jgi:hypothetical protein
MPPKQQSKRSAQLNGQASADSERPGAASSAARKETTGPSKRRRPDGKRSKNAKDEDTGHKRPASDRQATIRPGSQLPKSRTATPPESPWDFEERQYVWATKDNESLKRNIHWQWHRTAQRLVTFAGVSSLTLTFLDLTRHQGLPPETAAGVTAICLVSGTGGYLLRELFTALTGRRPSGDQRSEADLLRDEDDPSS